MKYNISPIIEAPARTCPLSHTLLLPITLVFDVTMPTYLTSRLTPLQAVSTLHRDPLLRIPRAHMHSGVQGGQSKTLSAPRLSTPGLACRGRRHGGVLAAIIVSTLPHHLAILPPPCSFHSFSFVPIVRLELAFAFWFCSRSFCACAISPSLFARIQLTQTIHRWTAKDNL